MAYPIVGPRHPDEERGLSYSGVFVRADRTDLLESLAVQRFTGWVGPQEARWVLLVPERAAGRVATGGLDVRGLARELARTLVTVALAARIERDRVLRLDAWEGEHELGSYLSDRSVDAPDPDEAFPEPEGAEYAEDFAAACDRKEIAHELLEVLAEELDNDSVFESERLATVLRLLGLPSWLVSATSLPGDVPAGPRRTELVRLGAGRTGWGGRLAGALTGVVRNRRSPRPTG